MGIKVIGYYDSKEEAKKAKEKSSEYWSGWVPYKVDSGTWSGKWSFKRYKPNPHEQRRKGKAGGGSVKKKNYAYGGRVAKYKD